MEAIIFITKSANSIKNVDYSVNIYPQKPIKKTTAPTGMDMG